MKHGMERGGERRNANENGKVCGINPYNGQDYSPQYYLRKEQREQLAIYKVKDVVLETLGSHRVIILEGDTGCGKSTQVPQFLLDKFTELKIEGKNSTSERATRSVVCTQPRKVAALSIAKRVVEEMEVIIGYHVGYSIQFDQCFGRSTLIKYCTHGVLVMELLELLATDQDNNKNDQQQHQQHGNNANNGEQQPQQQRRHRLSKYSVIILDEVHERTVWTDVLMSLLKALLKDDRLHFKIIIMSATMDSKKFSRYFGRAPIITVPGYSRPFSLETITRPTKSVTDRGYPDYVKEALNVILEIIQHRQQQHNQRLFIIPGDILVFLTGEEEIERACSELRDLLLSRDKRCQSLVHIYRMFARLSTDEQVMIPQRVGLRSFLQRISQRHH